MTRISRRECIAAGLAVGACTAIPDDAPKSLNALAEAKGLRFGSCLGTGNPRAKSFEGKFAGSFNNPAVRALTLAQCGIIVPENELKWYALRTDPGTFNFRGADVLMDFAQKNALAVRGHTLLWNRAEWFPPWVAAYDFGSNPAGEAERLLRAHIAKVSAHCGRRIFAWDVVNETIDHDTGALRETIFTKYLGARAIDIAYRSAREGNPAAQLVYNDYMSWGADSAKHRSGVLRLLGELKKRDVPVDALGVQSHIGPGATDAGTTFSPSEQTAWRRFLDEATGMGLDIVITEFDVGDQTMPADIAERDGNVAALARDYLDLMLSYRQLRYVMAWGLTDRYSWLQGWWPRTDSLPKRPCPYDADFRPKLLRAAIADAFRAAPARPPMQIA